MSSVCVCSMVPFFYLQEQYTLAVVVAFMNAGFRCFVVAFRKAGFERGIAEPLGVIAMVPFPTKATYPSQSLSSFQSWCSSSLLGNVGLPVGFYRA